MADRVELSFDEKVFVQLLNVLRVISDEGLVFEVLEVI